MKDLKFKLLKGLGHLPIHVQIRHCLEYAIGFGQLPPSTRLPSVRELATELAVAPNTVSRAYQELRESGLLVTKPGRGTFVSDLLESEFSTIVSGSSLKRMLQPAIASAQAVGFSRSEIMEATDELLADRRITVGFVAINRTILDKWSAILEQEFGDLGICVTGFTLDEVHQDLNEVLFRLQSAHRVFTLVTTYADVRGLLHAHGKKVSALLSELSAATHQKLANLLGTGLIGLVCRDFYASSLLGIISAYVDPERVRCVSPDDENGVRCLIEEAKVIVHTLAATEQLIPLARPETKLIEVEFVPNRANFEQLHSILKQEAIRLST
jgi:GntR family transcriptional regulator